MDGVDFERPQITDIDFLRSLSGKNSTQPSWKKISGKAFLEFVEKAYDRLVAARVGDLSHLASHGLPTYQSYHPYSTVHANPIEGNFSSISCGLTSEYAKLSCLMKGFATLSGCPQNEHLIRNSFDFLKEGHQLINPEMFYSTRGKDLMQKRVLAWTMAYSLKINDKILIPAEAVYVPFSSKLYNAESIICTTAAGMSAGLDYISATTGALYNLLESSSIFYELKKVKIYEIDTESLPKKILPTSLKMLPVSLFYIDFLKSPCMPIIMARTPYDENVYEGVGVCADMETAVRRAVCKIAEHISINNPANQSKLVVSNRNIAKVKIKYDQLKDKYNDHKCKTASDEFKFLLNWLEVQGYSNVILANLTRPNIAVPVIKAIIPEMPLAVCGEK